MLSSLSAPIPKVPDPTSRLFIVQKHILIVMKFDFEREALRVPFQKDFKNEKGTSTFI